MMKLRMSDIITDLAIIETRGDSVRGIEMGSVRWRTVYDSLSALEKTDTKAGRLLGYPFRVTESLGETVNYLLAPHDHVPAWVARADLKDYPPPTHRHELVLPVECSQCGNKMTYTICGAP